MNKEQTKTLIELWNEVGERPSYFEEDETPYYPGRIVLKCVLRDILESEISSVSSSQHHDDCFSVISRKLSENLTSPSYKTEYPSWTLGDFRSTFDWNEHYSVSIHYPCLLRMNMYQRINCCTKEEVVQIMSGRSRFDDDKPDPIDDFDDHEIVEWEDLQYGYNVEIYNLRLKESVVKDMDVSVS